MKEKLNPDIANNTVGIFHLQPKWKINNTYIPFIMMNIQY